MLTQGEQVFVRDLQDPVLLEPLAVIFGGGVEGASAGMCQVHAMMGDFVRRYLAGLVWIGVNRGQDFSKELARYLED